MSEPTELTFETGYERLKEIAERLNQEEVPVSEMCDLFAEGKGLEQALTGYLDTQSKRVEKIERGDGIQAFRIVGATPEADTDPFDERNDGDFQPVPLPANTTMAAGDDDIPF
jgi:exodeoxyribonuclease VII small subunit